MTSWQDTLVLAIVIFGSAFLGAWFQRKGATQQRMLSEAALLTSAMESLLVEIEGNIQVIEDKSIWWMLTPLSTDMWQAHKGKIIHLPLELRHDLQRAYFEITKANVVVQTVLYSGSGGGAPFQEDYDKHLSDAKGPVQRSRDGLDSWLKSRKGCIQTPNSEHQQNTIQLFRRLEHKLDYQWYLGYFLSAIGVGLAMLAIAFALPKAEVVSVNWFRGGIIVLGIALLGIVITSIYFRRRTPKGRP